MNYKGPKGEDIAVDTSGLGDITSDKLVKLQDLIKKGVPPDQAVAQLTGNATNVQQVGNKWRVNIVSGKNAGKYLEFDRIEDAERAAQQLEAAAKKKGTR